MEEAFIMVWRYGIERGRFSFGGCEMMEELMMEESATKYQD